MASKLPSFTTSSQPAEPSDLVDLVDDVDYFPMIVASAQAAVLTLVGNLVMTAYLAMQMGAGIQLRLWGGIFPIIAIDTDLATFSRIVTWAAVLTAGLLGAFSLISFFGRAGLRVRAGRLFAWIDIALLGAMQLYRHYYVGSSVAEPTWMWAMVVVGIVAFAVGGYVVSLDGRDREAELRDLQAERRDLQAERREQEAGRREQEAGRRRQQPAALDTRGSRPKGQQLVVLNSGGDSA